MATICLIALLLIPTITQAQSGDREGDTEPNIICTSHINCCSNNSLTCTVDDIDGENDNEVEEIFNITICFNNMNIHECFTEPGNSVLSEKLQNIITFYNVTFQLKGGDTFTRRIDLKKIIKPKSPWVVSATFHQKSNRAEIHIGNRYLEDYLKPDRQLFELHLWSEQHTLVFNITSGPLYIEGEHLQKDTEYHVKVRAIPTGGYFEGYWSDWSSPLSFFTHSGKMNVNTYTVPAKRFSIHFHWHYIHIYKNKWLSENYTLPELSWTCFLSFNPSLVSKSPVLNVQQLMYVVVSVTLVLLLIVACHWKKTIYSCIWPGIPQPKHTVLQIYQPCKGPLMTFKPEVLRFQSVQQGEELFPVTQILDGDIMEVKGQYNTQESHSQVSDCSCSTEESESILLSGGSPADSMASSLGILDLPNGPTEESDPDLRGSNQKGKDEAYVTMSSFFQIKGN